MAESAIIWAKLDGEIRGFIVERGTPGFDTPKIDGKMSLRASTTGMIALTDCAIAEDAILPDAKGLRGPFSCLNKARYGIAWGSLGAARSEEHTSELQSIMRISYSVFCL